MAREASRTFSDCAQKQIAPCFYKALDPNTQLAPAYEVCLFIPSPPPYANNTRCVGENHGYFGPVVLIAGFVASHFISEGLSKPVDEIVAGSVEKFYPAASLKRKLRATPAPNPPSR